jgi:hypothetical protein
VSFIRADQAIPPAAKSLGRFAFAARMIAQAINVRSLLHRLARLAAILAFVYGARTNRVRALLAIRCHMYFS